MIEIDLFVSDIAQGEQNNTATVVVAVAAAAVVGDNNSLVVEIGDTLEMLEDIVDTVVELVSYNKNQIIQSVKNLIKVRFS